jgi:hypothetical protein
MISELEQTKQSKRKCEDFLTVQNLVEELSKSHMELKVKINENKKWAEVAGTDIAKVKNDVLKLVSEIRSLEINFNLRIGSIEKQLETAGDSGCSSGEEKNINDFIDTHEVDESNHEEKSVEGEYSDVTFEPG